VPANFLIGLREGLEASLVVGILVAYLVRTGNRAALRPLWAGVGIAIVASLGVGALLTFTSRSLTFSAQEAFGGTMSLVAVAFVTWMVFWMRRTARSIKGELEGRLDAALATGARALVVTAFLAVAREGLETALFLWSTAQAASGANGSTTGPVIGATLGILTATVLGWLLYKRAVKLNLAKFFTVTGALLVVVAAGVLAYGFHDLLEAGVLKGAFFEHKAFDVSHAIPPSSWYGTLLKGIFNFRPDPTVFEVIVYLLYLVPVLYLFFRGSAPVFRTMAPVAAALLLVGCASSSKGATIAINASDTTCEVSATRLDAGAHTFHVSNDGKDVTEVYVYAEGDKVVTEKENIGPGTSADFTADLAAGHYQVACKPGQKGDGIRTDIHVSGSGGPTAKAADTEVELEAKEYAFEGLSGLSYKTGQTVKFEMENKGSIQHEFEVFGPDGKAIGEIGPTDAGKDGEVVLTFASAGTYRYACGIDDHEARGMKGTFTVA